MVAHNFWATEGMVLALRFRQLLSWYNGPSHSLIKSTWTIPWQRNCICARTCSCMRLKLGALTFIYIWVYVLDGLPACTLCASRIVYSISFEISNIIAHTPTYTVLWTDSFWWHTMNRLKWGHSDQVNAQTLLMDGAEMWVLYTEC